MGKPKSKPKGEKKEKGPIRKALSFGIFLSVLYLLVSAGIMYHLIGGNYRGLMVHPSTRGVDVAEVEFKNDAGMLLKGWYSPVEDRPIVLIAHGRHQHRGQMSALYTHLFLACRLGFLVFDFRASGESEGMLSTGGVKESQDLEAALDWLESKGHEPSNTILVAYDMGATAAFGIPDRINRLNTVIFVAPSEGPRRNLARVMKNMHIPLVPTASLALIASQELTGANFKKPNPLMAMQELTNPFIIFIASDSDEVSPLPFVKSLYNEVPGDPTDQKILKTFSSYPHGKIISIDKPELARWIGSYLAKKFE
jgi:alpha/beta superfamily hydrolase